MLELTSIMSKAEIKKQEAEISMKLVELQTNIRADFLRILAQILFLEYFHRSRFYFRLKKNEICVVSMFIYLLSTFH